MLGSQVNHFSDQKATLVSINQQLKNSIQNAIQNIYQKSVEKKNIRLLDTPKHFKGSHTLPLFALSKMLQTPPLQVGEAIGTHLQANKSIQNYQVIQGFLNLHLPNHVWIKGFKNFFFDKNRGISQASPSEKIVIEYASPNTNKPLHLGHLRNIFLGDTLARIFTALGHQVTRVNLINDRGIHICQSMTAYQLWGSNTTPDIARMKGDHFVGMFYVKFAKENQAIHKNNDNTTTPTYLEKKAANMLKKWEKDDPHVKKLWKKMNSWVYDGFKITLEQLGITFDQQYYESTTYHLGKEMVQKGLSIGLLYKKENGSIWADLSQEGLDQKLLLRPDGTSVYITQDLGNAQMRYEKFQFDRSIYVVGNEQDYHFKALKLILKKLHQKYADHMYHFSYGMVTLPEGRMKSREGTIVDADHLMEEMHTQVQQHMQNLDKKHLAIGQEEQQALERMIALGALRYFLLKVEPKKNIVFDPKSSIDLHGHTAAFIQYTHARICSLFQKHTDFSWYSALDTVSLSSEEKNLIIHILKLPEKIQEVVELYNPSILAQYVYDLAKLYNKIYTAQPILQAPNAIDKQFRLLLSYFTQQLLQFIMDLLGITLPKRM